MSVRCGEKACCGKWFSVRMGTVISFELWEMLSFNGTLEEFAKAVSQPVRVRRAKDWKRPR